MLPHSGRRHNKTAGPDVKAVPHPGDSRYSQWTSWGSKLR